MERQIERCEQGYYVDSLTGEIIPQTFNVIVYKLNTFVDCLIVDSDRAIDAIDAVSEQLEIGNKLGQYTLEAKKVS